MKSVCLFFQVHQPFRHRKYRFFDIGKDHYYYDDYANETILRNIAENSYLPTNKILLELIDRLEGRFKIAFSITGLALEQFDLYAPEVIKSFQQLSKTGCVEFLAETYSHSLASLKEKEIFENQVRLHDEKIFELFKQKPRVFRNTEMIYSDEIGQQVADMGYMAMLTEGAKHILGWKSPNFMYVNAINPRLKILMRNFKLSDDISFRFSDTNWSEFPLTADKFVDWFDSLDNKEEVINLFLSYESFGERQKKESGVFEFLKAFPDTLLKNPNLKFATPTEVIEELQPISTVSVPHPISWADEERDLTAWLGNKMQKEAYNKLYELQEQMNKCKDNGLIKDWNYLQSSDHFHYMSTKYFSDGEVHKSFTPFDTPYEAFINYMNVLSDFKERVNSSLPDSELPDEVSVLKNIIREKDEKIQKMENEIKRLKKV